MRYTKEQRVWEWSDKYFCMVSIIPGRAPAYCYPDPNAPRQRNPKEEAVHRYALRIEAYLEFNGASTLSILAAKLKIVYPTVKMTVSRYPQRFEMLPVKSLHGIFAGAQIRTGTPPLNGNDNQGKNIPDAQENAALRIWCEQGQV